MNRYQENEITELKKQINHLEIKISFQDHTIELLNDILVEQQNDIGKLATQLRFLLDKFKAMEPSNIADDSEETPPPHY